MRARWYGHVDMDAFFASVELLDQPELAGRPVAVGGRPGTRGVIAAASYEARKFGVRSAMPTSQALRLCPQLVLMPGRMERYCELSGKIMKLLRDVAPIVEPLSLDEAALDLSGCDRLVGGNWERFAQQQQRRIFAETGLWASIGLGETRRIAKMASDANKPKGICIVPTGEGADWMQKFPVERIWGIGPSLRERLSLLGILTGADLAARSRPELQAALGKTGLHLHDVVHAKEGGRVPGTRRSRSVSHETTFAKDRVGSAGLEPVLLDFADKVARRLRRGGFQGRVVQLKIRDGGFHTFTRRRTLAKPTANQDEIYTMALKLWNSMGWEKVPVRLIGVGVHELSTAGGHQGELFAAAAAAGRPDQELDATVDGILDRFGESALGRAKSLLRGNDAAPHIQMAPPDTGGRA